MMAFIIGVFIFGLCSIVYVAFPISSYMKLFEILKHMYVVRKNKREIKKLKISDKP